MVKHRNRTKKWLAAGASGCVAAGTALTAVLLGGGVSSAAPASLTLNYTCPFPLIGTQTLPIRISADVPDTATVGEPTPAFDVTTVSTVPATATQGLTLVGAATVEGSAAASSTVTAPEGTIPVTVPATIPTTPVPASGSFDVTATGSAPSMTFTQPGTATITVGDVKLTLHPKRADGSDTGLGTFDSQCTQVPGQNNTLATITINGGGTTTEPTTTEPTTTEPTTTQPTTTEPTTTEPTTTAPTTTPGNPGGGIQYGYALQGSSTLKKLGANVPLTGGIDANLDLATGAFTADLTLDPSSLQAKLFHFIPITANVAFQQEGQTTGTLANGVLTSHSSTTIKLPVVKVLGFPISKSPSCRTSAPSDIALRSGPGFDPLTGGNLSGTYDVASLTGCGPLNGLISALATGPGNTINATLTPKAS
ncbi:hypothetical protein FHX82_004204 [Amycolatopsis bartoniae]|uniref:DUF6801 domain-containing protein n=1 Tax=Amycolatopsis bartoniae TaxID=941986 RepID=A0A8H9IU21_9PSEU|nr:DUF6801 domain-containing protein [Amycolatopsis bartoniae]MBB2937140.1 hypothetical protein [Amycolatopsis bartoniae]TVT06013.1 hypothetical protein FNH07_21735 [Amycolatopsis bartoniae]GHF52721.1 hypothetical protein GCM10017566_27630 [Amycolatopsis bartoniae]